jgi:hypothetical protein
MLRELVVAEKYNPYSRDGTALSFNLTIYSEFKTFISVNRWYPENWKIDLPVKEMPLTLAGTRKPSPLFQNRNFEEKPKNKIQ